MKSTPLRRVFCEILGWSHTESLAEARDYAACVVRALIMEKSAEDWRDWVVHVSDDFDDEIFEVSFSSVLGKPN